MLDHKVRHNVRLINIAKHLVILSNEETLRSLLHYCCTKPKGSISSLVMWAVTIFCLSTQNYPPKQTRDVDPLLHQCWPTVCDAGPTLIQQWINVSCLLGRHLPSVLKQSVSSSSKLTVKAIRSRWTSSNRINASFSISATWESCIIHNIPKKKALEDSRY